MKSRLRIAAVCASVLSLCLFFGCPMPVTPPAGGSLTITVADRVSRTLLPAVSMQPASYSISGTGPNGASFSQSTSSGSLTLSALAFGTWTVTVNALNSDSTLIGQGFGTAEVHTGSTTSLAVTVTPLSGSGTLSLAVSWPASQVQSPSILASLLDQDGTLTPLPFTVSGSQASFSSAAIPAGYHTLTVQVLDNGVAVAGAVEVARIVAGQTTSGSYAFANVNQPGGSLQVNITPAMADPIPLSIGGVSSTLSAGSSLTATASTTDGTTGVTYVWYLNGANVGTGPSLTFGSALAVGYYRLDVTGFTADGTRGGSATASFQVTGTTAPLARWARTVISGGGQAFFNAVRRPSEPTVYPETVLLP